jgi:hypothetical protein
MRIRTHGYKVAVSETIPDDASAVNKSVLT